MKAPTFGVYGWGFLGGYGLIGVLGLGFGLWVLGLGFGLVRGLGF